MPLEPLEPGTQLQNKYRIEDHPTEGGFGYVYPARHLRLDHKYAIKENNDPSQGSKSQFRKEAQILCSLEHNNIVRVYDYFDEEDGRQYLVMDFVEGRDLFTEVEQNHTIPEDVARHWMYQIGQALDYLHKHAPPVIHGDIKPENIVIRGEDERPMLVDFGLAKLKARRIPSKGPRHYSAPYASPEQRQGKSMDRRSDIYSYGATFCVLLTGDLPTENMIGSDLLKRLRKNRKVSPSLKKCIEKMMADEPKERYQSVSEFLPLIRPRALANSALGLLIALSLGVIIALGFIFGWIFRSPILSFVASFMPQSIPTQTPVLVASTVQSTNTHTPSFTASFTPTFTMTPVLPTPTFTLEPSLTPTETETVSPTITFTLAPQATAVAGGGQIAYVKQETINNILQKPQIWLIDVDGVMVNGIDGANPQPLATPSSGACQPDWSPDGMKLAFVSPCKSETDPGANAAIWVLDMSSGSLSQLTFNGSNYDPDWSHDGIRIAFTSTRDSGRHVYVMQADGSGQTSLTKGMGQSHNWHPAWSPDDSEIVFASTYGNQGTYQLFRMNIADLKPREFTRNYVRIDNAKPDWNPNPSINLMLFEQDEKVSGEYTRIVVVPIKDYLSSSDERAISDLTRPFVDPAWSPDGRWVVFSSWPKVNHNIYYMRNTGGDPVQVTDDPAREYQPAWRPQP